MRYDPSLAVPQYTPVVAAAASCRRWYYYCAWKSDSVGREHPVADERGKYLRRAHLESATHPGRTWCDLELAAATRIILRQEADEPAEACTECQRASLRALMDPEQRRRRTRRLRGALRRAL